MKIGLILLALLTLTLPGCLGKGSTTYTLPLPKDTLDYADKSFKIYEQIGIQMQNGQETTVYTRFHYSPKQTDSFIGEELGNTTSDFAVLSKPLYYNEELEVNYLDNIVSIGLYDSRWNPIPNTGVSIVSYNPATKMLILDGFPSDSQTNFKITYYHSLPGVFVLRYITPKNGEGLAEVENYPVEPRAAEWVRIKEELVKVDPFMIKHVPVTVAIPKDAGLPKGYKFKFQVGVGQTSEADGMTVAIELKQWWIVEIK